MKSWSALLNASCRPRLVVCRRRQRRGLLTLAIETSCDDTAVAVLEANTRLNGQTSAVLRFHKKITSNNSKYHGVHPLASLYSHQETLASLVDEAILHLPLKGSATGDISENEVSTSIRDRKLPDFISVTRGPGMRSNLFCGIDTAKGLAAAWQIDLVGVHHMQAHALTPRLVSALHNAQASPQSDPTATTATTLPIPTDLNLEPEFPFLSVLASGGHTLLIQSSSLTDHKVLATTIDTAIGDLLDKTARAVLPLERLQTAKTTMYGALLEKFAFPQTTGIPPPNDSQKSDIATPAQTQPKYTLEDNTAREYQAMYATRYTYAVPKNREAALLQNTTKWGWSISTPLSKAGGGVKNKSMEMSFSGLNTSIGRLVRFGWDAQKGKFNKIERAPESFSIAERKDLAREAMRAAFEHLGSRVVLGLQHISIEKPAKLPTVVMSGGVAANSYLRYILASMLVAHGYPDVRIVFPPPSLCTDNAAMIAWAGMEMYAAGYKDPRTIRGIRKWPLDQLLTPPADDVL